MTLIAQISDLHVQTPGQLAYGVVDTNRLVAQAIAQINQLQPHPDAIVASGDLVQHGTIDEYETLKTILSPLRSPLFLMPGNHDCRANLRQVFTHQPFSLSPLGHLSYAVDCDPLRLILLDNTHPKKKAGWLDEQRLKWLAHQLEEAPQSPTIIFMHHPPFLTGIPWMDRHQLEGERELKALVAKHQQVERVSCGHLHRGMYCRWAGAIASAQPSLVHQGGLELRPDTPSQFVMEPPAYQLHIWKNQSLISHIAFIGKFDGPYRFSDGRRVTSLTHN
ncbi:putative phosphohydrolase [Rubidibacter lacunae KORDI 51-2]|uniref:Putative phosphohydrolase n=1 Tax=Rubidibacter lacunae KORDI 51-2 TaxID=582515 RepID=U5DQL7_9CHRO|nr:phosphodiesterase [Rubidibacter lacunae]ERN42919.1 putative phosphohydrolase [Rubidibacter lacunae KORDI 51-2]